MNITIVHPSAVYNQPPSKLIGFVPALLYLQNLRAGLIQGGSTQAEPDTLSHTSVATISQPSAIIALCQPMSANPQPLSAYLCLHPLASVNYTFQMADEPGCECAKWYLNLIMTQPP
ncbi:hypothetical protein BKA83DRAFT_4478010 [Pisolithus microcarpus]|nr:hypothetical protein BKA83DRAFT_4478010 [Pisolithus microcarpus]